MDNSYLPFFAYLQLTHPYLRREFDVIPHLDGPDHKEVLEANDAFALCSCLSGEALWRPAYRSSLKSKESISMGIFV